MFFAAISHLYLGTLYSMLRGSLRFIDKRSPPELKEILHWRIT